MQEQNYLRPVDPTYGLEIVSAANPSRAETRYLFTALNALDPDHILQRDWMTQWDSEGGEEIETNCFRRTLHGFLPRATLIPLEVWTRSYPIQFLSEGAEDNVVKVVQSITPESMELQAKPQGITSMLAQPNQHVKFYPGEEMPTILRNNEVKGIVQIEALQNQEWYKTDGSPGVAQILNNDFFPSRPTQLSKIEELIDKTSGRSELHRAVGRRMKISCQIGRRWAETTLGAKHVLLRTTNSQNFAYTYTGVERSLLAQLEMQPQDVQNSDAMLRIMDRLTEAQSQNGGNVAGASPELIAQIAGAVAREFAAAIQQPEKRGPGRPPKDRTEDENKTE